MLYTCLLAVEESVWQHGVCVIEIHFFFHSFQTGDGVSRSEQGVQKQLGPNDAGEAVEGQVQWTDNEGQQHQLRYRADENGYQPEGDLVPGLPPAIARALEWNAAHPEEEDPRYNSQQ